MCGILAISSDTNKNLAELMRNGLFYLNHRGQEGAGMASFSSQFRQIHRHRNVGLVRDVFSMKGKRQKRTAEILSRLTGKRIIGHTRYSTVGASTTRNMQPQIHRFHGRQFAIAHNGQIGNIAGCCRKCEKTECQYKRAAAKCVISDTEIIGALISSSRKTDFLEALIEAIKELQGTFVLAVLFDDKIYIARDRFGNRPVALGQNENFAVISSENCVFPYLSVEFARDIQPGEILILDGKTLNSIIWEPRSSLKFCIFELIYFARPDSSFFNNNLRVADYRKNLGKLLADEYPINGDVVVPIMDSGIYAALSYYKQMIVNNSNVELELAWVKNRYVFRTFIRPENHKRKSLQPLKDNLIPEFVKNKKVAIVDDSLVRGITAFDHVARLRKAGAKEIHYFLSCPPIKFPCYYGIDMQTKEELAAGHFSIEEIRKQIGADSLNYLSFNAMIKATGFSGENFCAACFTGKYPIPYEQIMGGGKNG